MASYWTPIISSQANLTLSPAKIFPNPAVHEFIIQLPNASLEAELGIYTLDGRLINSKVIFQAEMIVDISDLASAMYIIRYTLDGQTYNTKLLKH